MSANEPFYSELAEILLQRSRLSLIPSPDLRSPPTSNSSSPSIPYYIPSSQKQSNPPSSIPSTSKLSSSDTHSPYSSSINPPLSDTLYTWLDIWNSMQPLSCKQAAVLVPLLYRDDEHYLILTRRTEKVLHHKGEISFPGGARDPQDHDLLETALRETEEEIGIPASNVRILGTLDDTFTLVSGFVVTPYLGVVHYPYYPKINATETKEILEIPFSFFYEEKNYWEGNFVVQNKRIRSYFFQWQPDTMIWGMTAYIIKSLCMILRQSGLHY